MRKPARGAARQSLEDIFQVQIWIMPFKLGGLDQAHDGGDALPRRIGSTQFTGADALQLTETGAIATRASSAHQAS